MKLRFAWLIGVTALTLTGPMVAEARSDKWLLCHLPDDTYVQISVDYFGVRGAKAECRDTFGGTPEGFF